MRKTICWKQNVCKLSMRTRTVDKKTFKVGDKVMLSILHHWREFTANDPSCIAKFIPCFDGPYNIVNSMPEFSAYTLDSLNSLNIFPTFHASQLKHFMENDGLLLWKMMDCWKMTDCCMTLEGLEEYTIERILDKWCRGRGYQYLVQWVGHRLEEDRWLPWRTLHLPTDPQGLLRSPWGVWGVPEESLRTVWGVWGLFEDHSKTVWGLLKDCSRTVWGVVKDYLPECQGLLEDSLRSVQGLN